MCDIFFISKQLFYLLPTLGVISKWWRPKFAVIFNKLLLMFFSFFYYFLLSTRSLTSTFVPSAQTCTCTRVGNWQLPYFRDKLLIETGQCVAPTSTRTEVCTRAPGATRARERGTDTSRWRTGPSTSAFLPTACSRARASWCWQTIQGRI